MQMVVANFAYNAGGWRVERHPRFMADVTGDGRADIVGFGDAGVWVSLNNGDGSFGAPQMVVANFAYNAGGWRVERHPRFMADVTGDGRADIVGFGDAGVWVSLNNGDGSFGAPQMVVANFAYNAGGWRVERHPRFMADTTGDGRADIVGFGTEGVWVSRAQADGSFSVPQMVVANFAYNAGGWRVERHPRFMADTTGDGRADIVGFGTEGVWVSRAQADGSFSVPQMVVANFAYNAGGWRVERHPRFMADTTGDGRADIVGFGTEGVWVSRAQADGSFSAPQMVVANFAYNAGGWRVERHPRFMAELTGDGRADIVGFGTNGVWVSRAQADGSFSAPQMVVANFAYNAGGWRVERHPRFMADVTGDGRADIVGFGDAGVWVALNNGDGTFVRVYVRREIWELEQNGALDAVTLAYAKAVQIMQARPGTDPTSWTFQSAIHGAYPPPPPGASWNQCQHQGWFFLPWHRMYLYFFERIVRAAAIQAGGPANFALPYWNYDKPFPGNTIPLGLRTQTLPDGSPNPLFLAAPRRRASLMNGGQLASTVTSPANALSETSFTTPVTGFGGGKVGPQHFGDFADSGALEFTPHNAIHVQLSGPSGGACQSGFMIDPNCAALDPVFWLHHANIDRLWNVWLASGGGRVNPPDNSWRTASFDFYDETGAKVTMTAAEVLDSALQLGYVYDDQPTFTPLEGVLAAPAEDMAEPPGPPELVAATEQPLTLTGASATVDIAVPADTQESLSSAAAPGPSRVLVGVEDIKADVNPGVVYGVYLNLPAGGDRVTHHVGNIALFGIEQMNDPDVRHEGAPGFRHIFDATNVAAKLSEQGAWDPASVRVTFEPIEVEPPPGEEAVWDAGEAVTDVPPVQIGRVSLFVS